jgi:sugar phosphate isomerase/epimerase
MTGRPRLGVSQFTTRPWTFEEDIRNYAELGIEYIEICEEKLDPARVDEQLRMVHQSGLTISSVQPLVRTLFPSVSQPEPKNVGARCERLRRSIRSLSEADRESTFVTNTGVALHGNIEAAVESAVREYRQLAAFAGEYNATIVLEPLSPTLMNLETCIWTIAQAMEVIDAVNLPNFGLCLDYWNVWQNPEVERHIEAAGDRIKVVHVSDWRQPRSTEDRAIPGTGEMDLGSLIAATRRAGFDGVYTVEIFSGNVPDPLWNQGLRTVIACSRMGFEAAWSGSPASVESCLRRPGSSS